MGNCISTCGGRRKILVPLDFEIKNIEIHVMAHPGSNEEASQQPQRHSSHLMTLPIGIALTTNEVIAAPASVVNGLASNQAASGSIQPIQEDTHSLTDSLMDITIDDIQVETARPINYSRPGGHRLLTTTSAYNIRDFGETSCGSIRLPRLRPSATMSNLNKPLPRYPNDDPVDAYISRENMMVEKAWKILAPDKAFLVDFNRERNVIRSRILRESLKSTSSNDVKVDNNAELVEEITDDSGTGTTQEVDEDSEDPKGLIRILRQKILKLDDMVLQLRADKASSKSIPSPVASDANDSGNPVTPSPIRRSNSPASAVTGTANTSELSTREAKTDMNPSDLADSPHLTGLPRRPRPVGIIGPSTPTRSPGQPMTLHYKSRSHGTKTEQPSMVSEAGPSRIVVRDTLPQVSFADDERDYSLYEVALEDVTKNYHEAKPVILSKVRRFVGSERTVARVVEAILALTDDVIDACVNDEDSLEIVQMMVTGSCQGSEAFPGGKMTPVFQKRLDKEAEATRERKAIVLLEKWAAEAKAREKADEEAKEKGKGKEKGE
ncbi:hypothetical protein F4814DRAFT_448081 [Daldinia grandis]|nr:hypothetical protein F4814DRAFT_448081 [Daldinia grandis]